MDMHRTELKNTPAEETVFLQLGSTNDNAGITEEGCRSKLAVFCVQPCTSRLHIPLPDNGDQPSTKVLTRLPYSLSREFDV